MFPICDRPQSTDVHNGLQKAAETLHANIARLTDKASADEKIEAFFQKLPSLQERLYKDAACYLKYDPAAKTLEEVIITYPGFYALCVHRIAHEIHRLNVPIIARLFSEYAHSKVGIDIHPAAKIGKNLFMDHGTGIVIGETAEIGDNVKIYQGVTLGALYVEKKLSDVKRHPTVEDDVVIYANATILGGETVIGHNSTIGGGSWLTQSVIPYSLVYNSVDIKIRTVKDFIHPHDFVI
jgi:Serine acetyltransferase